jgi:DNA-binding transcriptional LysR family regulator
MELRHLRYFVAVAEALSFRKAARRLSVSAAAVSQQMADLENELGLKLFNRNSRRVELTEVGRVFLRGARRMLATAQEAVAQAQEAARGERGRLTIGSIRLVHDFLPDALVRFRELFPLVEVTVLDMDNRSQVEALENGKIMLGIGYASSDLVESESLTVTPLLRSSFSIACAGLSKLSKLFPSFKKLGSNPVSRWQTVRTNGGSRARRVASSGYLVSPSYNWGELSRIRRLAGRV